MEQTAKTVEPQNKEEDNRLTAEQTVRELGQRAVQEALMRRAGDK